MMPYRIVRTKPLMVNKYTKEEFDKIDNWYTCPSRMCDSRAAIAECSSFCPECGIPLHWPEGFTKEVY